jgi:Ca2+-binding RTX toxin-like protein
LGNYVEAGTAADYASASAAATAFFAGNTTTEYYVVQVGSDVVVFQGAAAGSVVQNAVALVGRTLADIDAGNISYAAGPDVIVGSAIADTLDGGAGNDTITGNAGDDSISGGAGNDSLAGGADNDTVSGGAGNDNLAGGAGVDQLTGGAGVDTFVFASGDTGITLATSDSITDFVTADLLDFAQVAGSGTNYVEGGTVADYAAALAAANTAMNTTVLYAAYQVGANVLVFADIDADGTADQSIILVGQTLANISETNVI